MENQKKQDNSLSTLRSALFNTIFDVRNGDMTANDANAIAKVGHQIIDTYKTEIEAVKVADGLKDKNARYAPALKAISDKDKLTEDE